MVEPGRRCLGDRYELHQLIAAGGMGQVWRGQDIALGRPVAVKVLRSEYTGDPTFRARFRAEAQLAASLSHPNIARVFDYGETVAQDGTGFEANPSTNTGFSDPDLTQDAGGRVYNTGIDLVNDALFSSPDGGRTWDRGTINCHDGDRPWLAAGPKDTVWLANDPNTDDHSVWISTDGGASCSSTGIADPGGYGKLFYDSYANKALHGALIEPVPSLHGSIGVAVLKNALHAFKRGRIPEVDDAVRWGREAGGGRSPFWRTVA